MLAIVFFFLQTASFEAYHGWSASIPHVIKNIDHEDDVSFQEISLDTSKLNWKKNF